MTFPKFNEIESSNQKNNCSTSGLSSYLLFNFPFNSPVNIKTLSTYSSLVFTQHGSKQHLDSENVFSLLSLLSSNLIHSLIVDSLYLDRDFENLILYLAYESPPSLPSFPPSFSPSNNNADSPTASQEEFKAFHQLSLH
jgi:hypothetical protein